MSLEERYMIKHIVMWKLKDFAEGKDKVIEELNIDLSTLYRKLKKYDLQ